jgi:integrase
MTRNEAEMNALTVTSDNITRIIANHPNLAQTTKVQYSKAILNAVEAGINLTDPEALAAYAQTLGKSSKSFLKAAIRLWSAGIELQAKGQATPDNVDAIQATVYRIEALNGAIQVESAKGQKAHTWLTQTEVKKLLATCNTKTIQGQRDRVVLGLLVGAGLRREELAALDFDAAKMQPVGGKFRTVLNVTGKGAKNRVVPISDSLAAALDAWQAVTGPGRIARSVSKADKLGRSLSAIGIFHIVRAAGAAIGKPDLAPHDLRRTYAQIGYEAGVPITQISRLLGHASVDTTQRYLNLDLNLETTISDFVPFV